MPHGGGGFRQGGLKILAAALLSSLLGLACQAQTPLETLGAAPDFNLVDQSGSAFGTGSFNGRVALVDFIYTNCTDICPLLTSNMKGYQTRLARDGLLGSKVLLVSVSVDPQHDTPAVLEQYAQKYGADLTSWKFVTGDWDAVYDVVTGFKISARPPRPPADAPAPGGDEITHSARLVVVDPHGQVRAYLHGDEATPDEVESVAKRALNG